MEGHTSGYKTRHAQHGEHGGVTGRWGVRWVWLDRLGVLCGCAGARQLCSLVAVFKNVEALGWRRQGSRCLALASFPELNPMMCPLPSPLPACVCLHRDLPRPTDECSSRQGHRQPGRALQWPATGRCVGA